MHSTASAAHIKLASTEIDCRVASFGRVIFPRGGLLCEGVRLVERDPLVLREGLLVGVGVREGLGVGD